MSTYKRRIIGAGLSVAAGGAMAYGLPVIGVGLLIAGVVFFMPE